jgi:sarcosine oxidase
MPAEPSRFDVAVAGLGVVGAATAWMLARRGLTVLGLDRYHPPHDRGSSHGLTRVIRETAFEHPRYVPLVRRAYEQWAELEREVGRVLLTPTGALYAGPPGASVVEGSRASATVHGVACDALDAQAIRRRWPPFRPGPGWRGIFEHRAGILHPEVCLEALLAAAVRSGRATFRFEEPLLAWRADRAGVALETGLDRYRAGALVLATGPWMVGEVAALGMRLEVERVIQHWFEPADGAAALDPARLPIFLTEDEDGVVFYGFPLVAGAVKCAVHHRGALGPIDTVRREVAAAEVEAARARLARWLPDAAGTHRASSVCVYTNTPDGDFLLDRHPDHSAVVLVSACSGIGFKFAPAIGELAADLVTAATPAYDLAPFRLTRGARC